MKTIQTLCPGCGRAVACAPGEIVLAIRPQSHATYTIACPICTTITVKRADELAERLLRTAGVTPITASVPPPNPESPAHAAPITHDDLLDFHIQLASDDLDSWW